MIKQLIWNVLRFNQTTRQMEVYNIFNHGYFYNDLLKLKKDFKKDPKLDLKEEIRKLLLYYFWCKAEWEIVISPWCGEHNKSNSIKIDVYNQVMYNFDRFCDYVIENLKLKRRANDSEN